MSTRCTRYRDSRPSRTQPCRSSDPLSDDHELSSTVGFVGGHHHSPVDLALRTPQANILRDQSSSTSTPALFVSFDGKAVLST